MRNGSVLGSLWSRETMVRLGSLDVRFRDLAFILLADVELVEGHLMPRLAADTDVSRAPRAVRVSHSSMAPEVTKLMPEAILRGVVEARPSSGFASQIASGILRPALASIRVGDADRWGISEADVGRAC